ncbi:hypothetical protein ACRS64_27010 [Pseudomonas aeruginosa]|uniref:hypothetical protein n=1 Tax=Pseudomonas aeruginosa TaxID=287 RepID=UPI003DA7238E
MARLGMLQRRRDGCAIHQLHRWWTIEQQQARSVADLYIQRSAGAGGRRARDQDSYIPLHVQNADVAFNGLYGLLPRRVLIEFAERVEVLKDRTPCSAGFPAAALPSATSTWCPLMTRPLTASRSTGPSAASSALPRHRPAPRTAPSACASTKAYQRRYHVDHQSREFPLLSLGLDFGEAPAPVRADLLRQAKPGRRGAPADRPGNHLIPHALDSKTRFGRCDLYLTRGLLHGQPRMTSPTNCSARRPPEQLNETIAANSILVGNQGDIVTSLARQRGDCCTYSARGRPARQTDTGPLRHDWTPTPTACTNGWAWSMPSPMHNSTRPRRTAAAGLSSLDGHLKRPTKPTSAAGAGRQLSFLEDRAGHPGVRRRAIESRNYGSRPAARAPATTSGTAVVADGQCRSSRCW